MSPRSALVRVAAPVAALALLTGCSAGASTGKPSSASAPISDLAQVSVTGAPGAQPTVKIPGTFSVKQTTELVLTKGTGPSVAAGQMVTVDYTGFNGADGKQFDTTFGENKKPRSFLVDAKQSMAGLVKGLTGQAVGSRVLIAIPPADGLGTQGAPSVGIGPTDTLLIVVDIKGARTVLSRATGTAVAPKGGLPTVKLAANGKPSVTLPQGNPPAQLVVQPLIVGKGPKVTKAQQVLVQYTGWIWPGGRQFDSSWDRNQAFSFAVGEGRVIQAWDEGIVGQTVGSQVLLVVPPDKGYGAAGNASGGIKGTDTLVFVVDILDAAD